jgi:hypothetical protein
MHALLAWLTAHWAPIVAVLSAWAAVASLLNKTLWPKPAPGAPRWRLLLHALLIDGPAFLPSLNLKGLFGLPFNVPFLSLSGGPSGSAPSSTKLVPAMLPLLFGFSLMAATLSGCSPTQRAAAAKDLAAFKAGVSTVVAKAKAYAGQVEACDPNLVGDAESLVSCIAACFSGGGQCEQAVLLLAHVGSCLFSAGTAAGAAMGP